MKKLLFALTFILPALSFAQIKISDASKQEVIGEIKSFGTFFAKITKQDSTCIFLYNDAKFRQITAIKSFTFPAADLDAIYKLYSDVEAYETGTEKVVELEDGSKLHFSYKKELGKKYAQVGHMSNAGILGMIPYLTQNQLKKLFGKS